MNRVIIIGNGFDMAHNLKTGYRDFIDDYWIAVLEAFSYKYYQWADEGYVSFYNFSFYQDKFLSIDKTRGNSELNDTRYFDNKQDSPFGKLCELIDKHDIPNSTISLNFKNDFLGLISNRCSLSNWVDIENEYYGQLKKILLAEDPQQQDHSIRTLNQEFEDVKQLLETYLTRVTLNVEMVKYSSIKSALSSFIERDDIATCKQSLFFNTLYLDSQFGNTEFLNFRIEFEADPKYTQGGSGDKERRRFIEEKLEEDSFKKQYCVPHTIILNFNYTNTAQQLYTDAINCDIINIHGELNNQKNPIIFGYGDELDEDYEKIEKLQNNDLLENIKSIKYLSTRNYRKLLEFLASDIYQVFIMGHSCGNSDRTLLNTLFEHNNCMSIKVYYRQYKDGTDDYLNLVKNISRNFNNKPNMRDIVVNRENCSPLVPVIGEK